MESLKWAWRKATGALSSIGSISFSGTDRRLFGHLSWSFDFFNDAGNQLSMSLQAELQPPSARAPTPELEAAAAAEDTEVSNSSGGGDGRAERGRGPTAVAEEARVSNASNSTKTIGELAVPMLGYMGIYSTIHGDEQLQQLHHSLYFPLLTFLVCGAYASLYSIFYALAKPTAGEGEGGEERERELVKREWLKVALTCTGSALSFRVALGLYN